MLGTEGFAGIPVALITLGSAASALLVGRLSQRSGRRAGLSAGFLAGGLGAIGVVAAAVTEQLALLFVSLALYGAGTSTNLQARYAGTDLAAPKQRAKAISISMVTTTIGAVAGPNLVGATGSFASSLGMPPLTGPFLLSAAAFLLAGLTLLVFLRPDPLLVAKAAADGEPVAKFAKAPDEPRAGERKTGLALGATVMVLTQVVMVAIMTMTPVHMQHHGHDLDAVGLVIGIHVAAMYLPSLATGILVDKIGRRAMACLSGITLLLAGLLAALAPANSLALLVAALALLGLGWNFGLISGTAQIVDSTPLSTRAKTQGTIDVLVALTGASGGALSGMIVDQTSYAALAYLGGGLSMLLVPVLVLTREKKGRPLKEQDQGITNSG